MIKKIKSSKGFTLIELIVVIAVLAILVLLASPRFFGRTQEAVFTKHISNAKVIQNASELYFMDEEDWPRLSDEPYTSEEIEEYAESIYTLTGETIELDPNGNYYDINYNALNDYVSVNDEDKPYYILQNPVGKVYYMDGLSELGKNRVDFSSPHGLKLKSYINSSDIIFSGLSDSAYDGNFSTSHNSRGIVTWEGDLTHRVLKINAMGSRGWWLFGNFVDESGEMVRPYNMSGDSVTWDNTYGTTGVTKDLIVPEEAVGFEFRPSGSMSIFNIWAPETLQRPRSFEINHTSTPHSITLKWESYTHAVIHKDGDFLGEVSDGNEFTDNSLYGDTEHTYEILFIDEKGNGQEVQYTAKTTFDVVALRGLAPETFGPDKSESDTSGSKTVHWIGDLSGHTLRLRANGRGGYWGRANFYNENGESLKSIQFRNYRSILTEDVIVPEGATTLVFTNDTRIYNVYVLE